MLKGTEAQLYWRFKGQFSTARMPRDTAITKHGRCGRCANPLAAPFWIATHATHNDTRHHPNGLVMTVHHDC